MSLLSEIAEGQHDPILTELAEQIKERQVEVTSRMRVGDICQFVGGNPKYLRGLKVQIQRFKPTKVVVKVVHEDREAAGKFGHGDVTTPRDMIGPLDF